MINRQPTSYTNTIDFDGIQEEVTVSLGTMYFMFYECNLIHVIDGDKQGAWVSGVDPYTQYGDWLHVPQEAFEKC